MGPGQKSHGHLTGSGLMSSRADEPRTRVAGRFEGQGIDAGEQAAHASMLTWGSWQGNVRPASEVRKACML